MLDKCRASRSSAFVLRVLGLLCLVATSSRGQAPRQEMPKHTEMRWTNTLFLLFDQLEYGPAAPERPVNFDAKAWYGGATNRLWLRAQSEFATTERQGEAEAQLLFGRLVHPFWDALVGVRVDEHWGDTHRRRVQLAAGFIGLAPYRFELEPTLFVSQKGEVSARLEAAYPLLLTQRLIAEPEFEINAALQDAPRYDVRRGLNDYEFGLRVRYEFRREFAPYVGWSRSRRIGGSTYTEPGAPASESRFVAGFRLWR
jgi:copper resistance protein B